MSSYQADREADRAAIAEAEQAALDEWNMLPEGEREEVLYVARSVWREAIDLAEESAVLTHAKSEHEEFRKNYIRLLDSLFKRSEEALAQLNMTALHAGLPLPRALPDDEVMGVSQPISFLRTIDETLAALGEMLPPKAGRKPVAEWSRVSTAAIRAVAERFDLRAYGSGGNRAMAADERRLFAICKQIDPRTTGPNVRSALKALGSR